MTIKDPLHFRKLEIRTALFFFFFHFLGPHLWHIEVPKLGIEAKLQLLAYSTTATDTQDPSHIWNLHNSSQQCQILNPLSDARD